jgi:CrcB protein
VSTSGAQARAALRDRLPIADRLAGGLSVSQARLGAIFVGGAAGALARAGLAEALPHRAGDWPWATFIANLAGALFLGWLLTRLAERVAPTTNWRPLLGTGLAGALTTFSTFQVEIFTLLRNGDAGLGIAYALTSIVAGMALAVVGVVVARWGPRW